MKTRIVLLTGSELRHDFVRKLLALDDGIEVIRTYCEGLEKSLGTLVQNEKTQTQLRSKHLAAREQSEKDYFGLFVATTPDRSVPVAVSRGAINEPATVAEINAINPDVLVAYGCSIVKEPLITAFSGRFLNVHLGLSPYYRGSGTNYWPLVNEEPEFVGATFMHIDPGIDTGEIIHQIRARIVWGDTPSSIGNRLIRDLVPVYAAIIKNFRTLPHLPQPKQLDVHIWKQKDYDEASVAKLYENFKSGLVERYLTEQEARCRRAPIVENPALTALAR